MDKGRVGGVHPPVSPVWQPRRSCWLVSSAFLAETREWAGSPPALPREGPLRFLEGKGAGELGGCPWSCFSRRDGSAGTSRPLSTPGFRRFQQQSFLKKMLVMATAPANSGQTLAHQPGPGGRRRGGARPGRVGLGGEPGHSSLLRWPRCKLRWLPGLS